VASPNFKQVAKTGVKMKKVYNVTFHNKIQLVEITRETASSVWIKNSVGKEIASY